MLWDAAAGNQPRTFGAPDLDELEYPLSLALRDERAHLRRLVERIANPNAFGFGGKLRDELIVDRPLYQMARGAHAGLSGADEGAERRIVDGLVEVEIVEHEHGRLATELERLVREVARDGRAGETPGLRAAGQRELVDARMMGQRLARGRAEAGHDVEYARG